MRGMKAARCAGSFTIAARPSRRRSAKRRRRCGAHRRQRTRGLPDLRRNAPHLQRPPRSTALFGGGGMKRTLREAARVLVGGQLLGRRPSLRCGVQRQPHAGAGRAVRRTARSEIRRRGIRRRGRGARRRRAPSSIVRAGGAAAANARAEHAARAAAAGQAVGAPISPCPSWRSAAATARPRRRK